MVAGKLNHVLSHMGRLVAVRREQDTPDHKLLTRFAIERDETAFAALMERHGAMVFGVCKGVLRNPQDAEDACQATFLVLARRARSVHKPGSLASWLHGTAWRISQKLRTQLGRRRALEASATPPSELCEPPDLSLRESCRILDEELNRLPDHHRAPIILCHLEGRTQDEAARELGWSLGKLRGRLERGRSRLRARLVRRGVNASAVLAATALGASSSTAALPPTLAIQTVKASVATVTQTTIPVAVSPTAAALVKAALHQLAMARALLFSMVCAGVMGLALLAIWATGNIEPTRNAAGPQRLEAWAVHRTFDPDVPGMHVWCVTFSPDGKRIAAGLGNNTVPEMAGELRLWEAGTGKLLYALKMTHDVRCVVFASDGKTLASAEHDGAARLRDAETGEVLQTFRGHRSNIDSVAFSADGKRLATSSWDGTVKVWDTASGMEIRTLGMNPRQIFAVAFNRDGLLAGAGADGTIRIWQSSSGQLRFILRGHTSTVHWLAFAPDGKTLASASWDKTVKLWDATTGGLLATLEGHEDSVLALAFSADGRTLASCSGPWGTAKDWTSGPHPGQVIVWDLKTQKARASMREPDRVMGVAVSGDGDTVAAAVWDGTIALWRPEPSAKADNQAADKTTAPRSVAQHDGELKFVPEVQSAGKVAEPDANRQYAREFQHSLKEKLPPELLPYGPDVSERVHCQEDGCRITLLPSDYASQSGVKDINARLFSRKRPGVGLATDFGVKGDFEITVNFEVLGEGQPLAQQSAELRLVVVPVHLVTPEIWNKADQGWASLAREAMGSDDELVTRLSRWHEAPIKDKWNNEIFDAHERVIVNEFPTGAKQGRLRLVRTGSKLFYYAGEGDQEFKLLHHDEFGTKDLQDVRILAATKGAAAAFNVRVTDLRIRADDLPKSSAAAITLVASHFKFPLPLALVSLSILSVALGAWAYLRGRRPAAPDVLALDAGGEAPAWLAFSCTGCGRRLKAKAEFAGKSVKCPRCQKEIGIPCNS